MMWYVVAFFTPSHSSKNKGQVVDAVSLFISSQRG